MTTFRAFKKHRLALIDRAELRRLKVRLVIAALRTNLAVHHRTLGLRTVGRRCRRRCNSGQSRALSIKEPRAGVRAALKRQRAGVERELLLTKIATAVTGAA